MTGQIGQSYTSGILSARFDLKTAIPMYLKMQAVASKQKFYQNETLFYSDRMPSFVTQSEQYVKLRLGLPFLTSSKAVVSVGYGSMTDRYYQSNTVDFSSNEQDRSRYNLFVASMKFDRNNLNSYMYPTAGTDCSVLGLLAYGKEHFTPYNTDLQPNSTQTLSWLQLEGNIHTYIPLGNKFVLGFVEKPSVSSKGLLSNYTSTLHRRRPLPHASQPDHLQPCIPLHAISGCGRHTHLENPEQPAIPQRVLPLCSLLRQISRGRTTSPITARPLPNITSWARARWC